VSRIFPEQTRTPQPLFIRSPRPIRLEHLAGVMDASRVICSSCGRENPDDSRFCSACGSPLEVGPASGVRKTVTVVFCDLVGSTALGERSDPEVLRDLMSLYHVEQTHEPASSSAPSGLDRSGGRLA
jgi:predicted amidophosphoribosyltransferase